MPRFNPTDKLGCMFDTENVYIGPGPFPSSSAIHNLFGTISTPGAGRASSALKSLSSIVIVRDISGKTDRPIKIHENGPLHSFGFPNLPWIINDASLFTRVTVTETSVRYKSLNPPIQSNSLSVANCIPSFSCNSAIISSGSNSSIPSSSSTCSSISSSSSIKQTAVV